MWIFSDPEAMATAHVRYQRGSAEIRVVRFAQSETVHPGRPSLFTSKWHEMIGGKVHGTYVMSTYGARISEFAYISPKGQKTTFEEAPEHRGRKACIW